MGERGQRQLVLPAAASAEETAAIVAAQARYLTEVEVPESGAAQRESEWLRTARAEALRGELPAFWGAPEALNQNY